MKLLEKGGSTVYEPYKYVMSDTGSIYLGGKLSYEELLKNEMTPFKLKAIISQYILKESSAENTLESEFYFMKGEGFLYETYMQLKVRLKVMALEERRGLFGKAKRGYKERIIPLGDFANIETEEKKGMGAVVSEVIISRLAMMSFVV